MKITKVKQSRIHKRNPNDPFSTIYADHMIKMKYANEQWSEPEIVPYNKIELDPATNSLHYGQAIFEGMKAFKNQQNEVLLFRPEENFLRMNQSATRLVMPNFDVNKILVALKQLLNIDYNWIPNYETKGFLYIRPLMIGTEPTLIVRPQKKYLFLIMTTPVKQYFAKNLNVLIQNKFSRAAPGGVGFVKVAGNYAATLLPSTEAKKQGLDEVVWTDASTHEWIEECGTMNVFVRLNDELVTPILTDAILPGITRDSLLQLAKKIGWKVSERKIAVSELIVAHQKQQLIEFFGCGTATVVVPFESFSYQNQSYRLNYDSNSYAIQLKEMLTSIQYGEKKDEFNWIVKVKN